VERGWQVRGEEAWDVQNSPKVQVQVQELARGLEFSSGSLVHVLWRQARPTLLVLARGSPGALEVKNHRRT
jgi:hypothetical protein